MVIFHSYVGLPEGKVFKDWQRMALWVARTHSVFSYFLCIRIGISNIQTTLTQYVWELSTTRTMLHEISMIKLEKLTEPLSGIAPKSWHVPMPSFLSLCNLWSFKFPGIVRSITSTTDLVQVEVWKSWLTIAGAQHDSAVGGLNTTQTSSTWRSTSSSHIATCEVGELSSHVDWNS